MDITEKTIKSERVYEGKVLSLKVDTVELSNGKTAKREEVEHSGGACVLTIFENKVVFVSQFRYAFNSALLELPAGKLESGEQPDVSAKRELLEETGLIAKDLELIAKIMPSPGYTNEIIYCYFAKNVERGEQKLDEDEFLNVEYIEIPKVFEMLDNGEITDAKTVVSLLYLKNLKNLKFY